MAPMAIAESPVQNALQSKRLPALRNVQVDESDNEVILTGSVASFYHKQLAQESILHLLRGRKLSNRLVVVRA